MRVILVADQERLASTAAGYIGDLIASHDGETAIGLAGGSSPRPTYERLARADVAWPRVHLWLSDERWVPPDHADSNGRMASESIAGRVSASFHRPQWQGDPDESALAYETLLRSLLTPDRQNIVLLGMGTDGHTASLFPGTAALDAPPQRWFVSNWVPRLSTHRLTATQSLISAADRVVVLVSGAEKAQVLAEVLEGPAGRYPIQFVRDLDSVWIVEEEASRRLTAVTIRRD